jgi:hypothetical protein
MHGGCGRQQIKERDEMATRKMTRKKAKKGKALRKVKKLENNKTVGR